MKRIAAALAAVSLCVLAMPAVAAAPTMDFLHASGGQVVDAHGRTVILRGINVNGLEDFATSNDVPPYPIDPAAYVGRCPQDNPATPAVALCTRDLDQIAKIGFDVIRLPVSWSLLEPTPGHLDPVPLARIKQVVGWARAHQIRVVIDLHQDSWSKFVKATPTERCAPSTSPLNGGDGAPAWASKHLAPACAPLGTGELSPAVQEAAQYFWEDAKAPDGVGLQEHYTAVVQELVTAFKTDPTVAGYELMNEPQPGLLPLVMDDTELISFHAKVINAVVAHTHGFRQLFFIEPGGTRNLTAARTYVLPWSTYSPYPNVVYAPHVYTGVFTADTSLLMGAAGQVQTSDSDYKAAKGDAHALGLPLWVGEFGNDPRDDRRLLDPHYEHQDALKIGGALWIWKEHGTWGALAPPYDTGGVARATRVRRISTVYPTAVVGTLDSLTSDPFAGTALLTGHSEASPHLPTLVSVPLRFTGHLVVTGASFTVSSANGVRAVQLFPRGGAWSLRIRP